MHAMWDAGFQIWAATASQYGTDFVPTIDGMLNPYTMHNSLALGEEEFNIVPTSFDRELLEVCVNGACSHRCCRSWYALGLTARYTTLTVTEAGTGWQAGDGVHHQRHLGH